jgi:hypothetical protein
MGNSNATPVKNRTTQREKKIKDNISKAQQATEQRIRQQTTAITRQDFYEFDILNTAQKQVERGDKPLNKNDLIAILVRLQPEHMKNIYSIQQSLTMKDLIALIRGIIYDTDTTTPRPLIQTERMLLDRRV